LGAQVKLGKPSVQGLWDSIERDIFESLSPARIGPIARAIFGDASPTGFQLLYESPRYAALSRQLALTGYLHPQSDEPRPDEPSIPTETYLAD
jgi:hypothetical protein